MKTSWLVAFLVLVSFTALAQETDQNGGAAMSPQMEQMQARMQSMRAQMEQIRAAEDPADRRRLMQEHMQSMQSGMMMMGEMMRAGMPEGQTQQCRQGDTECRMDRMQAQQDMMGQRMGMMQQMMQQMMEQIVQPQQTPEGGEAENHEEHH